MKYKYLVLGVLTFLILISTGSVVHAKQTIEVSYTSVTSSMTKNKLNLYENGKLILIINIFGDKISATKSKGR